MWIGRPDFNANCSLWCVSASDRHVIHCCQCSERISKISFYLPKLWCSFKSDVFWNTVVVAVVGCCCSCSWWLCYHCVTWRCTDVRVCSRECAMFALQATNCALQQSSHGMLATSPIHDFICSWRDRWRVIKICYMIYSRYIFHEIGHLTWQIIIFVKSMIILKF